MLGPPVCGPFFLRVTMARMTQTLELRDGAMRCVLAPALGGCVTALWFDDVPVLRSTDAGTIASARRSASYPLAPWSNRIGQAAFDWDGRKLALSRNDPVEPHAIHGTGWQSAWSVERSDGRSAALRCDHAADAGWPFAFSSTQTFLLGASGLEQTLSVTNTGPQRMPAGLGWHPWFMKRARSRIAFEATGRWEMGDDKLPTKRSPSRGIDSDCAFLAVDHCFDGWTGVVDLRDESLHTRITSDQRRLVVCTDDTRDAIAIEPVSHVNNALGMPGGDAKALGIRVLEPGETATATMAIAIEHAR